MGLLLFVKLHLSLILSVIFRFIFILWFRIRGGWGRRIRSPGAGVTYDCEPPDRAPGTELPPAHLLKPVCIKHDVLEETAQFPVPWDPCRLWPAMSRLSFLPPPSIPSSEEYVSLSESHLSFQALAPCGSNWDHGEEGRNKAKTSCSIMWQESCKLHWRKMWFQQADLSQQRNQSHRRRRWRTL